MTCQGLYNRLYYRNFVQLTAFVHSSAAVWKVLETPSPEEVCARLRLFPKPKRVIHQLFTPFIKTEQNKGFKVQNALCLNGRAWKTHLYFKWPQVFTVTGQSTTQEQAEENAYLLACDVYKFLGVLSSGKAGHKQSMEAICGQHYLLPHLEKVAKKLSLQSIFHFVSTCTTCDDGLTRWSSELHISYPFNLTTCGTGMSQDAAEQMACLNACIKLKAMGFFSSGNSFDLAKIRSKFENEPYIRAPVPDFTLFVDASSVGYGALLTRMSGSNFKARWISDTWPDQVSQNPVLRGESYVGFLEFYAAVTAVYTWKHKFVNKNILIWSDNQQVVYLINKGEGRRNRAYESKCRKILEILIQTCKKYNITVRAQHLSRLDNVAADILSKLDLERFRAVVPDAYNKRKKTKKLLFFLPFKEGNTEQTIS